MSDNIRERSVSLENKLKSKLYGRMPEYIYSNDLFENWIKESLNKNSVWVDAGCGKNALVYEFQHLAANGYGIDEVVHPDVILDDGKFIRSNLINIPFENSSVDLIVANMVVEHIEDSDKVLKEIHRILKPGGFFIFRTTNKWYPTLLFGNLLPKKFKDKIIYKIFGIKSHDIFETTYPLNTLGKIRKTMPKYGFNIKRLEAVEDIHLFNSAVFEISYLLYKIQRLKIFTWLRNCIVCQVQKP